MIAHIVRRLSASTGVPILAQWTPASLASGLRGWWPANSLALAPGTPISSLPSSGGITNTLSQATSGFRPALVWVDGDPGLPAMDFDGVDDALTMSDHSISNAGSAITVCVLFRLDAIATDANGKGFLNIPTSNNTASRFCFGLQSIAGASKPYGFTARAVDSNPGGTVNNWSTTNADLNMHVAVATMNLAASPTRIDIWLDGTSIMGTTSAVATGTWDATDEGGGNISNKLPAVTNQGVDGKILDITVHNAVLSLSDRQKMEGYLAGKGRIQANLPAGHPYRNGVPML